MCRLLERVKEKTGLTTYAIAKEIGVSQELASRWSRNLSHPNGENTLKLAKLGELNIEQALLLVTEKEPIQSQLDLSTSDRLYIM